MTKNYAQYLNLLRFVVRELHRVLKEGRIVILNFQEAGLNYRDRIIWQKTDDYLWMCNAIHISIPDSELDDPSIPKILS